MAKRRDRERQTVANVIWQKTVLLYVGYVVVGVVFVALVEYIAVIVVVGLRGEVSNGDYCCCIRSLLLLLLRTRGIH